jgi:hypothetical protein
MGFEHRDRLHGALHDQVEGTAAAELALCAAGRWWHIRC